MFDTIVDLSQKFIVNIFSFADSILDFLNYEFTIGEISYTLFELLFTSAIISILIIGILRFIIGLILPS